MTHLGLYARWGLAVGFFAFSPVLVIFSVPLAVGLGLDVFEQFGPGPIAAALTLPGAFLLLRAGLERLLAARPIRRLLDNVAPLAATRDFPYAS